MHILKERYTTATKTSEGDPGLETVSLQMSYS